MEELTDGEEEEEIKRHLGWSRRDHNGVLFVLTNQQKPTQRINFISIL